MAHKVGRDEPCHCGSGLKYKRCHGAIVNPRSGSGNLALDATATTAALVGLPGSYETFHQLYVFKDGDPRASLPPEGAPGPHEITFLLQRPGYAPMAENRISFDLSDQEGDSHLAIAPPAFRPPGVPDDVVAIQITAPTPSGLTLHFKGLPNRRGYLGKLVSHPFHAQNRADAQIIGFGAIAPALSDLSLQLDIPLQVAAMFTRDLTTGAAQINFRTPVLQTPMNVAPVTTIDDDFRAFASLYREAASSASPTFEFLCLFKILESVNARRTGLERAAKRAGTNYQRPTELLPITNNEVRLWLDSIYSVRPNWDLMGLEHAVPPEFRGRTFDDVISKALNPLRVNIAHALFQGGGGLSADNLADIHRVTHLLPLTKAMARRRLKNDFSNIFLAHVPD